MVGFLAIDTRGEWAKLAIWPKNPKKTQPTEHTPNHPPPKKTNNPHTQREPGKPRQKKKPQPPPPSVEYLKKSNFLLIFRLDQNY